MSKVIVFMEREVSPQGLTRDVTPNDEKVREYFFDDDYEKMNLLKEISPLSISIKKPLLLYPGCGVDILFPLHYLDYLFPEVNEAKFIFVDTEPNLGTIKTVLDDVGVTFEAKNNAVRFYWKKKLITLIFVQGNIFSILDKLHSFDIYFERAFRIMKEDFLWYESKVVDKLNKNGVLISDSGFKNANLKKLDVSKELSSYGEMIIGVK